MRKPPADSADSVEEERTFGLPAAFGTSGSYSRADHTHGTPDLVGDAYIGGDGRTVVGSVNGIPVVPSASAPPTDNQVLLFTNNRWVSAEAPPVPLAGDVTGQSNDNELSALKGVPFVYNPGTARQGQVLTYTLVETRDDEAEDVPSPPYSPTLSPIWVPADLTLQGAAVSESDPESPLANGQVLTYLQPDPEEPGQWQAAPLSDITLVGDVTGEINAPTSARPARRTASF